LHQSLREGETAHESIAQTNRNRPAREVPSKTENKERGDKKERKTNLSHHTTYGSNQTLLIAYTDESWSSLEGPLYLLEGSSLCLWHPKDDEHESESTHNHVGGKCTCTIWKQR